MPREFFRLAAYSALALSLVGLLLVSWPIIGLSNALGAAEEYFPQIAVGYLAMILLIEGAGVPMRAALMEYWAGAIFAICLFFVGAFAGSATSLVIYHEEGFFDWIVKPLYWLGLFGVVPAIVVGLIGTAILRRVTKNTEQNPDLTELSERAEAWKCQCGEENPANFETCWSCGAAAEIPARASTDRSTDVGGVHPPEN